MKTYTATAAREGRWWILTVDDVGTTQARNLEEARDQVRSLVSIMLEIPDDAFDVAIAPALDAKVASEVEATKSELAELADRQAAAAVRQRELVRRLIEQQGLSRRDAASVLGVSHQRISQLLAEPAA